MIAELALPGVAEIEAARAEARTRAIALSQWHTPAWLAKRMVSWAGAVGGRWLDPACGHGALMLAALAAPQAPFVTGVDLDPDSARQAWRACAEGGHSRFATETGDGLVHMSTWAPVDLVIMNPPYERGLDCDFVEAAMGCSDRVIALVRLAFVAGKDRYSRIWSHVDSGEWGARIAFLPQRPSFALAGEASGSPLSDFCAIKLARADAWGRLDGVEWWRECDGIETAIEMPIMEEAR